MLQHWAGHFCALRCESVPCHSVASKLHAIPLHPFAELFRCVAMPCFALLCLALPSLASAFRCHAAAKPHIAKPLRYFPMLYDSHHCRRSHYSVKSGSVPLLRCPNRCSAFPTPIKSGQCYAIAMLCYASHCKAIPSRVTRFPPSGICLSHCFATGQCRRIYRSPTSRAQRRYAHHTDTRP